MNTSLAPTPNTLSTELCSGKDLEILNLPPRAHEPRVAVIREEFVALTKDHMTAIVLNQLVYWTERVKDFDFFLAEEKTMNPACNVHPRHGWIYKSAEELSEETMMQVSQTTMRRYLQSLITAGWIDRRSNAENKWDKTVQYRVNLRKLQEDLAVLGYVLPGTSLRIPFFQKSESFLSDVSNGASNIQNERSNVQNGASNVQNGASNVQNGASSVQNERSISEITSETINKDSSSSSSFFCNRAHEENSKKRPDEEEEEDESFCFEVEEDVDDQKESSNSFSKKAALASDLFPEMLPLKMLELWKEKIGQAGVQLTDVRKQGLSLLLSTNLQNDLSAWESLCEQIKSSRFLMGEGESGWKISLDWLLKPANLCKVMEGKFYDKKPKEESSHIFSSMETPGIKDLSPTYKSEVQSILNKIKDPTWKKCCSQLPFNPRSSNYVMPWKLEDILNARFLGIEDERLMWVSAADKQTMLRIEDLRSQFLTIIQRIYPKVRALRVCLEGEDPLNGTLVNRSSTNSHPLSLPSLRKLSQETTEFNTPLSHCPTPAQQPLGDSHAI